MRTKYPLLIASNLFAIIFLGLSSCINTDNGKQAQVNSQPQMEDDSLSILNTNIEYLLPSPNELLDIIFRGKIDYKPEYTLEDRKHTNIINSNFQALLLGVYISDFSYTLIYNDFNRSAKYFETIKTLAENLGISGMLNDQLFLRVENNLNNIDSLKAIYSSFSQNSFSSLSENGSKDILSLIAMGASIESIYLGYNVFKTESYDNSLRPFFVEQRMVFENFFQNYANYNFKKKDLRGFNHDLSSFYSLFKLNIWLIVDKNKLSKVDSLISLDVKYIVKTSSDNVNDLGKSICNLRENLINLKYQ